MKNNKRIIHECPCLRGIIHRQGRRISLLRRELREARDVLTVRQQIIDRQAAEIAALQSDMRELEY